MEERASVSGEVILAVGIVGIVFIFIFSCIGLICGLFAWSMGDIALRHLNALKIYDSSERTLAAAGRVCGIIASLLFLGAELVTLLSGKTLAQVLPNHLFR